MTTAQGTIERQDRLSFQKNQGDAMNQTPDQALPELDWTELMKTLNTPVSAQAPARPPQAGKADVRITPMSNPNLTILKQLRQALAQAERRGMTRYRIAKTAGVAPVIITRIMRLTTRPRLDIAERIAQAVGYQLTLTKRR